MKLLLVLFLFASMTVQAQNQTTSTDTAPSPTQTKSMQGIWKVHDFMLIELEGYKVEDILADEGVNSMEELWDNEDYHDYLTTKRMIKDQLRLKLYSDGRGEFEAEGESEETRWKLKNKEWLMMEIDAEMLQMKILSWTSSKLKLRIDFEQTVVDVLLQKLN